MGALDAHIRTLSLLEAIAADVTEVRLNTPVVRVDQTGNDVVVTTAGGDTVSAAAVVVATPLNIWNDIDLVITDNRLTADAAAAYDAEIERAALEA